MKNLIFTITVFLFMLTACETEDKPKIITQGDYSVKEYFLERDPKVNVWGAGIDFIHTECDLESTELDYEYMTEEDSFGYDIKFYTVKAYYYANNGDLKNEGCPAILLSPDVKACKLGAGVSFFDSLSVITEEMTTQLCYDHEINYGVYKDESTGFYDREALSIALDSCIIGQSFRGNVLEIPDGKTEEEVQPVYLIETDEKGYVKFMVKQFKGDKPNEKKTLVRWQVISEE